MSEDVKTVGPVSSLAGVEAPIRTPQPSAAAASPASLNYGDFDSYIAQHMPDEHLNKYGALNVVERLHNIVNLVISRAVDMNLAITPQTIDQLIIVVQTAYDKYIAPLDIPGIPNVLEPAFDRALRNLIAPLMRAALGVLVPAAPPVR
jgi:hypothetical protein